MALDVEDAATEDSEDTSTERVETRRTMRHESLLTVWSFNTPYRAWRLSLVNHVPGADS